MREVERLIYNYNEEDIISLFYEQGQLVLLSNNQVITSRTLEGTYPNYRQLVPESFSRCVELDRQKFISTLERIAILADQHNNVIKIATDATNQVINITADVQDVGSGSESVSIKLKGEDIKIAFNVKYVLEGLRAIDSEKIFLSCNSPTTPAILSPSTDNKNFTYLVMPIQIRA